MEQQSKDTVEWSSNPDMMQSKMDGEIEQGMLGMMWMEKNGKFNTS